MASKSNKPVKKAAAKSTKTPVEPKLETGKGKVPVTHLTDATPDTGTAKEAAGKQEAPKGESRKDNEPTTAKGTPVTRDPRLPSGGSWIEKQYKGKLLRVKVLEKGFEHEDEFFTSLSKLARAVTGQKSINGYAFFKLAKAKNSSEV